MSAARWAWMAAVCSAVSIVLFVIALLVAGAERHDPRMSGPYAVLVQVILVLAGIVAAALVAWRYERLARRRLAGRSEWRVGYAWWAVFGVGMLIVVTFPPSAWAVGVWVAALGSAVAATRGARLADPSAR